MNEFPDPQGSPESTSSGPIETYRIQDEINTFSRENKVHPNLLDFELLGADLYYAEEKGNFSQVNLSVFRTDEEMEEFLRGNIILRQNYRIEIIPKDTNNRFSPDITFGSDPKKTTLKATLMPTSNIPFTEGIGQRLKSVIYKKMALMGMLIGIYEEAFDEELARLEAMLLETKALTGDLSVMVCSFPRPIDSIKDKIAFLYLKKTQKQQEETKGKNKLPFAEKEEILVKYRKSKAGQNGRNLIGDIIRPAPVQKQYAPTFEPGPNIKIVEDEDFIEYRSAINGYIVAKGKLLDVTDTLEVETVSLKATGSIETDKGRDTKVKVSEEAAELDGIESGVTINNDYVELHGNMAGGAVIKAKEAVIKGQTHTNAEVYARAARINIHRGLFKGSRVMVNKLERGRIHNAIEVMVNEGFGSEIRAEKIIFKNMLSNNRVYATRLVEIHAQNGEGNVITVTVPEVIKQEEAEDAVSIENRLHELRKEQKAKQDALKNNFGGIEKEILGYKRRNVAFPEYLRKRYETYVELKQQSEKIKKTISRAVREKKKAEERDMHNTYEMVQSKVVCHSGWREQNKIIFELPEPEKPVVYIPKFKDHVIMLENDENGRFVVKTQSL